MDTATCRMPEMTDARRRGLAMLLGARRSDDLLAWRVAVRLATAAPRGARAA